MSKKYLENIETATGQAYSRSLTVTAATLISPLPQRRVRFPVRVRRRRIGSRLLLRIADLIERDLEQFARAESIEYRQAPLACAKPRHSAGGQQFSLLATAILHTESEAHVTDGVAFNYTLRQPRGIIGLISPWNLPLYLLSWKIAPAIACGNTAMPNERAQQPMTAYLLCEICAEAGLPTGVLNVVHGTRPNVGAPMTAHPKIGTISFTGGTVTGRKVAETCAPMFKKVSLELGGKNPNIIFADADQEAAIAGSLRSSFANQGQVCLCGSRVFVERSAYQGFVERFVEKASQLRLGDPLETATDQGAIVSKAQLDKVKFYVDLAQLKAVKSLSEVRLRIINERCESGYFFPPRHHGLARILPRQREESSARRHHHAVQQ